MLLLLLFQKYILFAQENCVVMRMYKGHEGRWADTDCSQKMGFVCQAKQGKSLSLQKTYLSSNKHISSILIKLVLIFTSYNKEHSNWLGNELGNKTDIPYVRGQQQFLLTSSIKNEILDCNHLKPWTTVQR